MSVGWVTMWRELGFYKLPVRNIQTARTSRPPALVWKWNRKGRVKFSTLVLRAKAGGQIILVHNNTPRVPLSSEATLKGHSWLWMVYFVMSPQWRVHLKSTLNNLEVLSSCTVSSKSTLLQVRWLTTDFLTSAPWSRSKKPRANHWRTQTTWTWLDMPGLQCSPIKTWK